MAYSSIPDMFLAACKRGGDRVALRHKVRGRWQTVSWREWDKTVRSVAKGLMSLGVARGDKVSILSNTRVEWVYADLGIICAGGITVPIYQSNLPKECEYVLHDSESKLIFVEDEEQLAKVLEVREHLPGLKHIVLMSGHKAVDSMVVSLDDLLQMGDKEDDQAFNERAGEAKIDDIASIAYTSGTTGPPKGAMLSQEGILFVADSTSKVLSRTPEDETLLFLPLAHIFARIIEFVCIHDGIPLSFAESIDKLLDNVSEIRPTFLASVPRIYEKIYSKVLSDMQATGGYKESLFNFSTEVGKEVSRHKRKGESIPAVTKAKYLVADRLIFSKLRSRFGGRLRFFVSGGAPLSKEIAEFFHAAGILILEGYGLTETTAVTNINRPNNFRFGSVGQPIPGVEQKIAPDGEVLSRSPGVMKGYFKREDETREVLDADGWFSTGDVGEFDAEGFLRITDRKKDIIITAGGKNIAPQNIENHLMTNSFISQVMVHGDKRKYVTALVTLNYDEVETFAKSRGISYGSLKELSEHPEVVRKVDEVIREKNEDLASYESVKKFRILPDDFTQEKGELTPTLKVKRKVVTQRYKDSLDEMYDEKLYG